MSLGLCLRPRLGLPGHGEAMPDVTARIGELRRAAEAETATVASLLSGEPATVWQVVARRYPDREMHPSTLVLAR